MRNARKHWFFWLITGLILGAAIVFGIFKAQERNNPNYAQAGFGLDLGPLEIDFGSRDYYYADPYANCYYGNDGYYYCDSYNYGSPYYYGYPNSYNYGNRGYYRNHHNYHNRHNR